ncbi:hypothetical protein SZ25_00556, partial [Candidatus Arcanobacter lacustris]
SAIDKVTGLEQGVKNSLNLGKALSEGAGIKAFDRRAAIKENAYNGWNDFIARSIVSAQLMTGMGDKSVYEAHGREEHPELMKRDGTAHYGDAKKNTLYINPNETTKFREERIEKEMGADKVDMIKRSSGRIERNNALKNSKFYDSVEVKKNISIRI